mmetsp:Transcript_92189/g.266024  ORF Transcript_92189/g.266024 Transcript_92189/m.266024 type:complete len:221 (-) Transcript_92189:2550-3212(-)
MAASRRGGKTHLLGRVLGLLLERSGEILRRRQPYEHLSALLAGRKGGEVQVRMRDAAAAAQVVGALVHGIRQGDLAIGLHAQEAAGDRPHLFVRADVLASEPPAIALGLARQVEDGDLSGAVLHRKAAVRRKVHHHACKGPLPTLRRCRRCGEERGPGDVRQVVGVRMPLLPRRDVLDLLRVLRLLGIGKLAELLLQLLVVDDLAPLALVVGDVSLHHRL